MIRLCSCTGGSASTLGSNKKQASTALCKHCGGKPLVDGNRSTSSNKVGAVGLDLNSDLNWNKVSKGNRSSTRRARKSLELGLQTSRELVNKNFKDTDMPVSESEKLGVTVLGYHFSEKADRVPIKKRRFVFRTPSPPPRAPSPCSEETETIVKRQHASGHGSLQNSTVECQLPTSDSASADFNRLVDTEINIHGKNVAKVNEQHDENEDFSGISILAAAACSDSLVGYVEEGSGVEEFVGHEATPEELINNETKDDLMNSAEMSTEGIGSSISPSPAEGGPVQLETDHTSLKELPIGKIEEGTFLQESAVAESRGICCNKDEANTKIQESSARDDRLHWDLNTVMDAWERPFDCQPADSGANVAGGISVSADDGRHSDKKDNLVGHELQVDSDGAADKTGKALSSRDTDDNTDRPMSSCELIRLPSETQGLNIEENNANVNSGDVFQGNILSEIGLTENDMDRVTEKESLHNEEKVYPNVVSGGSVPANDAAGPPASGPVEENVSANQGNSRTSRTAESLSSHLIASRDLPMDSLSPESGHPTSSHALEENSYAASTNAVIIKSMDDCADGPQASVIVSSCSQADKQNVPLPSVAFLDKAISYLVKDMNVDGGDARRSSELLGDGNVVENMACLETSHERIDDVREGSAFESNERCSTRSYHTDSVVPTSGAVLGDQSVAPPVDSTMQHGDAEDLHTNAETDAQLHVGAEEPGIISSGMSKVLFGPSSGLSSCDTFRSYHDDAVQSNDKVVLEEPLEDGYDTDISQGDPGILVGIEKSSDFQVDYDSQYEDGELRESSVQDWQVYDAEDEETEHVDYGSDNRDNNIGSENTDESNPQACLGAVSFWTEVADAGPSRERVVGTTSPCTWMQNSEKVDNHDKGSGSGPDQATRDEKDNDRRDNVKEPNQQVDLKMKMSGWDRLPGNRRSTSDMARGRDDSIGKNFTGAHKDGSDAEDAELRMFGSRINRRELLSHVERPASHHVFFRRDRLSMRGSSSNDDLNRRSREFDTVRSFGRGRYSLQRGRGSGRWVDSSGRERGLKRHRSPSFHGLEGGVGSGGQAGRQTTNVWSHGLHRSLRHGSPTDRLENLDVHRGIRAAGEMSPDGFATVGRGRSLRYSQHVNSGGPRGRYRGPVNDEYIESSLSGSHPLTKRRRSFSPIERRGNPPSHRSSSKSPSRARSRSPNDWQSPRGRNAGGVAGKFGFRHRSRSPNYRSGDRMPRVRSPHLRPGFSPDHEIGFLSVTRSHDSPPPNSRWIGYKQRSSFVDRRSPGRLHPRGERLDMFDSPRKLKPNEYYRSLHPGRFSESNGIVGRGGPRYEGADDDRAKPAYRYGFRHPAKRYDLEGTVRRFRYDVEDGFVAGHEPRDKEAADFHGRPKGYSRGTDSRIGDVPRRSREERGTFFCGQDKKYNNANSKSFGMRGCDEDAGSRRPS